MGVAEGREREEEEEDTVVHINRAFTYVESAIKITVHFYCCFSVSLITLEKNHWPWDLVYIPSIASPQDIIMSIRCINLQCKTAHFLSTWVGRRRRNSERERERQKFTALSCRKRNFCLAARAGHLQKCLILRLETFGCGI